MSSRSFATALSVAFLFGGTLTAAVAGPSMSSSWKSTELSERECLQHAERSVRDEGFNTRFEIVGQSVFGERGDYTVLVRCATSKGIVFFVVAGPRVAEASRHQRAISGGF
jgi:hypothetical protein